jgi:[acyl-carrier-protein] S-malonyltransferase
MSGAVSSTVAWVFPGQGSQAVGMAGALVESDPAAARLFATADEVLGLPLGRVILEGPAETLQQTDLQQPAIVAASLAMFGALRRRERLTAPLALAGHSLGQYSALVAAGSLAFADAIRLVAERGRLMQAHGAGAMAAILNLDEASVAEVAAAAGVEVANVNAPGQITISGRREGIERALELARARGARRAVLLPVSAAFHSSLMRPVVEGLRSSIESVALAPPLAPLISNVDARSLVEPAALRRELLDHICAPVQWVATVRALLAAGATEFVEIGPGRILSGLIRRIGPEARVSDAEALLQ